MSVFEEIGSPELNADQLREWADAGGMLPPGLYAAKLVGAKNTESAKKGTPGYELTFVVSAGRFAGAEVTDTLYRTENQKSRDRIAIFAHRLGLLKRSDAGKLEPVPGKADFIDVLDTPAVIEVVHEPDQNDPNKRWVRLAFCGVHDPADPKVKEKLAKGGVKADAKPAAGKERPAADAKPQRNLSDL